MRKVKDEETETIGYFHGWNSKDGVLHAIVELENGFIDQWHYVDVQFICDSDEVESPQPESEAWDWSKVDIGTEFRCKILDISCEGKVQKEGENIYLCQDLIDGVSIENTLGYGYAWSISDGSNKSLLGNAVTNLELFINGEWVKSSTN